MLVVALALTTGPVIAAVPQEAYTRIAFAGGCSGHGYWIAWDSIIYPDPVPSSVSPGALHQVTWSPTKPITQPGIGPEILEEGRYEFLLLDRSRETVLFRGLYAVQLEPRRFVLDVTLDCSTIPYTIVSLGDTAMEKPEGMAGPPLAPTLGVGCLLAALILIIRRRSAQPH